MLMGSTSSLTPWFSTQVSPSCSFSSNSNPYCMPEQPPPWMKTRSLRLGLPSPRIRSPTLRAAASVNVRVSVAVSLMGCTLRAGFGSRNRGFVPGRRRGGGLCRLASQRNEFARYDGTGRHFNDPVVDISIDACLATEDQALARVHIAIHRAVHHDVRDLDAAFDEAGFADRKRAAIRCRAADVAVHASVEMQAAGKFQVALQVRGPAEQRVDARGCLLASPEHYSVSQAPLTADRQSTSRTAARARLRAGWISPRRAT